jgi:hypothetical protein
MVAVVVPDDEDLTAVAAEPVNEGKPDDEMYRLAQVKKLLRLFERDMGRPATGSEDLDAWLEKGPPGA